MRCLKPKCEKDAMDHSNYCSEHRPGGGPVRRTRRVMYKLFGGDAPKGHHMGTVLKSDQDDKT